MRPRNTRSVSTTSINGSQADTLHDRSAGDDPPSLGVDKALLVKSAKNSENTPAIVGRDIDTVALLPGEEKSNEKEVVTASLTLSVELKKPEPLTLSNTIYMYAGNISNQYFDRRSLNHRRCR